MKKLDKQLQKLDIYEYDDLESQRLYDEVKTKITQALRAHYIDKGYLDPTTFTKRDLGIKATAEIYQAPDGAIGAEEIQREIDRVGKRANKFSQKESRAIEFIKACMSEGFYGYLRLRKWIGIPLESFTVRTWYAGYLPVIPLLVNPGGEIKIRDGNYTVKNITLNDNICMKGVGTGTKLILDSTVSTTSAYIFKIGDATTTKSNIKIENMYLDGNERNITSLYTEGAGAPTHVGVQLMLSSDVHINKCYFYDFAREVIWITQVNATTYNDFEQERIIIDNNIFEDNGYVSTIETTKGLIFADNIVKRLLGGDLGGISYVLSLNYLSVENIIISNNVFDGVTSSKSTHCITQGGTTQLKDIVIAENTIRNFSNFGIRSSNAVVANNRIRNVGFAISGNFSESIIIGNKLRDINGSGIHISTDNTDVDDTVIANNVIKDVALSYTQTDSIYAIGVDSNGTINNVKIFGNDIRQITTGKLRFGIFIANGTYSSVKVANNTIVGDISFKYFPTTPSNGQIVINNIGFNPVGNFTAPAVPASGTELQNTYGYPCLVTIYGGTVTDIAVGHSGSPVSTGLTTGTFVLAPGEVIVITYSAAPSWKWYGL